MMSVAGGWFFLMACEMFVLKDRDFRLPGIGSYIQTAANKGDMEHVIYGIATMILLIIIIDILIWRPLVAWSQKFRIEMIQSEIERESIVLDLIRKSTLIEKIINLGSSLLKKVESLYSEIGFHRKKRLTKIGKIITYGFSLFSLLFLSWALLKAILLFLNLSGEIYFTILKASIYSLIRTSVAIILAALWTVPLGVYIGMNPKASRIIQPIVQIMASVPATAIFPVVLLFLIKFGGGISLGSILLMLLGTQWYILFNAIAGASALPQDLKEIAKVYGLKGIRKWRTLIIPGIFPYLVTGFITATGGAWNATIVSEYVTFGGETLKTMGLGSLISESTENGNFGLLLLSTVVMAIIVISINRLLWKRLFALAREKYRLD